MIEHADPMKSPPVLHIAWRMLMALAAGLAFGLLGSLLPGHPDWFGPLFLALAPLLTLLGMIGMLTVGPRKKRRLLGALGIGWLSWFGIWLAVLVWESFQSQMISDCFHADPPCQPTTVPFWGDYAWLFLFVFFFWLMVGLVYVLVGAVITGIVLNQRTSKPKSSQ